MKYIKVTKDNYEELYNKNSDCFFAKQCGETYFRTHWTLGNIEFSLNYYDDLVDIIFVETDLSAVNVNELED